MSPIFGILFLVLGAQSAVNEGGYYPVDINNSDVQNAWNAVELIFEFDDAGYGQTGVSYQRTLIGAQYQDYGPIGGSYRLYYTPLNLANNDLANFTVYVQQIRNQTPEFLVGDIKPGFVEDDNDEDDKTSTTVSEIPTANNNTLAPEPEPEQPTHNFVSISPSDSSVASAFDAVQTDLLFKVISLMGRGSTVSLSEPTEARNKNSGLDTDSTTVWLINFTAERENEPNRDFVAAIVNDPTSQVEYNLLDVVDANEINSFIANYPVY